MCGSTPQQTEVSDEENQFYKTLTDQYSTVFGQSQAITGALTSAFMPILQAGPSQTGFSPSEENALRTQNLESVGTNYAQAQKATAQILAARGGGNTLLPSSVDANILAGNTNAAAAQRSQGDLGITQANYQQGYQNWQSAAGILGSTAGLVDPSKFGGMTTTAGGAAMTGATDVANASNSPWNAAFGALGAGAGLAAGKICWIAAEVYGGWHDPRTDLVRRWLIENFTGHWMLNLYIRYGERTAAMMRKYRPVKWIFTGIFNGFLRQATQWQAA